MKTVKEILEEKKRKEINKMKTEGTRFKGLDSGNALVKYYKSQSLKKTVNVNIEPKN